ncbi:hypothetical protein KIN20_032091 [Parelaphostrongylus tenuis]|uniref:Uncharacterized protein n=1 Tax=Parelaphostrongylus tenuis TaxID=148309 RepID=A0AAD5R867_PARTN|nr:hypothetical protein KIN20_032091 [Parelaphostrongylus tenuis]
MPGEVIAGGCEFGVSGNLEIYLHDGPQLHLCGILIFKRMNPLIYNKCTEIEEMLILKQEDIKCI